MLKLLKSFLKACGKLGFNKTTGWLYWKMFFNLIFKNPAAIETAVSLSAMFIHFHSHTKYIIDTTTEEIEYIQNHGEENYIQLMLQENCQGV
jgi:hypothetical protein